MIRSKRKSFWIIYSKAGQQFETKLYENTQGGRASLCLVNCRNWFPTYPYSKDELDLIQKNFIEKNDYKPFIKAYIRKPIVMRLCFIDFVTGEIFEGWTGEIEGMEQPIKAEPVDDEFTREMKALQK